MDDILTRFLTDLVDRVTGPMNFRLLLQPMMAAIFAIRDGLDDARSGRPPYFWSLFRGLSGRGALIRSGWQSIGKVFVLAIILDVIYQFIVARFVYPGEAAVVAFILAIVPYATLRGLVTRLTRKG